MRTVFPQFAPYRLPKLVSLEGIDWAEAGLDVAVCALPHAQLIPLNEMPARMNELPRDRDIVLLCHHGMRSYHAAEFLQGSGFTRLFNLHGGIAADGGRRV